MDDLRIRFDAVQRHEFTRLAGIYMADFESPQWNGEPSITKAESTDVIEVIVPEGMPAFLSSAGFAFQLVD